MNTLTTMWNTYLKVPEINKYKIEMNEAKESYKQLSNKIEKIKASLDGEDSWFLEYKSGSKTEDCIKSPSLN